VVRRDREFLSQVHNVRGFANYFGNLPEIYTSRGWVYEKKGDFDRDIADYEQALALDPDDRDARTYRDEAKSNLAAGDGPDGAVCRRNKWGRHPEDDEEGVAAWGGRQPRNLQR
jgi:tetratricopeptide (TPR) repeat protein